MIVMPTYIVFVSSLIPAGTVSLIHGGRKKIAVSLSLVT
jgi:hypothetical protein